MLLILAIVVLIIAGIVIFAAMQDADFTITRSLDINAPAQQLYDKIADFHGWGAWSPFEKLDPAMLKTFSGPAAGVGAAYAWSGNSKIGAGRMKVTEAAPASRVAIALDFERPFAASNIALFTLAPQGAATRVTWAMTGKRNLIAKIMSLFMNMDTMIGGQFAEGLANLKALSEK